MRFEIGFIGCGNMGGALARAVAKNLDPAKIALCDADAGKAERLAAELGAVAADSLTVATHARFVVLGVKPQMLGTAAEEIGARLRERKDVVVISMLAGTSCATLRNSLGFACPLIRIMPNTPAMLGEGVILYVADGVTERDTADFCAYFAAAGLLDPIDESRIDAASALSGCGPAFVYIFAEALADAAVECGIPRDKALAYAARTVCGAGRMIEEFGNPAALKDAVCSAGGTTIAGVHALERGGLRAATMDAVTAAYQKTLSLTKK